MVHKAKPLFAFFHAYESKYGDLNQIAKLEDRMTSLFPDDPSLSHFSSRFAADTTSTFDPTRVRPLISMATQAKPKLILPSIERTHMRSPSGSTQGGRGTPAAAIPTYSPRASPRIGFTSLDAGARYSPKRALPIDLGGEDGRPSKLPRGESPLKGAAGRRLDAAKRRMEQQQATGGTAAVSSLVAPPLPRDVSFFLSILPHARYCEALKAQIPPRMVMAVLKAVNLGAAAPSMARGGSGQGYVPQQQQQQQQQGQAQYGYPTR
jgi:cleavage stimulation factor subunit 3